MFVANTPVPLEFCCVVVSVVDGELCGVVVVGVSGAVNFVVYFGIGSDKIILKTNPENGVKEIALLKLVWLVWLQL